MGLFSGKKKEEPKPIIQEPQQIKEAEPKSLDVIKTPTKNVSVIKEKFNVKATIEGEGSLIVGGILDGDVKIDDTLFIEKGARVTGIVHAKNVKISGDFEGTVYAYTIEITKSGRLKGVISSNKAILGGYVNGVIRSIDSIEITATGIIDTKECKSKQIKVVGSVDGRVIASELLEVTSGGSIKGDIITKGIRTEQGGSIIGNIQTYDAAVHEEDENEVTDSSIENLIDVKDIKKYAKKEDSNTQSSTKEDSSS